MATDPRLVLFDIDGTLLDTGGAGARSWAWAFERLFEKPDVDIGRYSKSGMTDPQIARHVFEEVMGHKPTASELTRLMASYLSVLPDFVAASEHYRVLAGAQALLERLTEQGVLVGLTTGGLEAAAHAKLGRGRLNHYFLVGGYGSDSENRARLTLMAIERGERLLDEPLDRSGVMVVGDTPLDVDAAEKVGAVSIAVASGRYSVEELRAAEADHVLGSLEDPFPDIPT